MKSSFFPKKAGWAMTDTTAVSYLALGYKLAWAYIRQGWLRCPHEDALQSAALGVVRATREHTANGCSLATIVRKRVAKEIRREHARYCWASRRIALGGPTRRVMISQSQFRGVYPPIAIVRPDESRKAQSHAHKTMMRIIRHATPKQQEVLSLLCEGLTCYQIAENLGRSLDSVHTLKERGIKRIRESLNG